MKKKPFLSLALALAMCLGLCVSAGAEYPNNSIQIEEDGLLGVVTNESGDGWSYDSENNNPGVLKLSGAQNLKAAFNGSCVIELAPGTRSSLAGISVEERNLDGTDPVITIRGGGELEILADEYGFLAGGMISEVKLEDGLVMTGGAKRGDSDPVTLGPKTNIKSSGWYSRTFQAKGADAGYVHIGPAAQPAEPTAPTQPAASGAFTDVAAGSPYKDAIAWAVEQGITNGTSGTTFSPGNTCTVRQILTFLYRASGRPYASSGASDLEAAAEWAAAKGVISGGTDITAPCTRAMAVTCMWKAAGSPAPSKTASFADIPASADYVQAVSWAVEQGITNGTGGDTFSPGGTCTRGQIVTFLFRAGK